MKKKVHISFGIALSVFFLAVGLGWLAAGTGLIVIIYIVISTRAKLFTWIRKHIVLNAVLTLMVVFLLAIAVRIFLMEIYAIPSGSMENTLVSGDKILVSKLNYGPQLPASPFEIPWINIFFWLNKETRVRSDSVWWTPRRLKGYSQIERGDVIVFQHPGNRNTIFVKRSIALPGDTLQIRETEIFINNLKQELPATSKRNYRIWFGNIEAFTVLADSLDLPVLGAWYRGREDFKEMNLSQSQCAELLKHACIDSIAPKFRPVDSIAYAYPWNNRFPWTIDQYGTLVIPAQGMKIQLNEESYILYGKILDKFEHFKPVVMEGKYYLEGRRVTDYTFKKDYFFMMGDNRHHSNDSRKWGLVPKDYIVGKAVLILYSRDYTGMKWDRFLRLI